MAPALSARSLRVKTTAEVTRNDIQNEVINQFLEQDPKLKAHCKEINTQLRAAGVPADEVYPGFSVANYGTSYTCTITFSHKRWKQLAETAIANTPTLDVRRGKYYFDSDFSDLTVLYTPEKPEMADIEYVDIINMQPLATADSISPQHLRYPWLRWERCRHLPS